MIEGSIKCKGKTSSPMPPLAHHRQQPTPTKSPVKGQHNHSERNSPAPAKKRKREASEPAGDGDNSDRTASPQPTSSGTNTAAEQSAPASSMPPVSSSSMARSPSTASIHPCNGAAETSQATSNDQSAAAANDDADDGSVLWRSRQKLALCLACDLCSDVLKDPVTAPECMHSFCRDCIDQHVLYGGTKNTCPVCKREGLQTVFGPQPFQHGKLQFDPMLADMTRKLFPRADVEKSILERHDAEAKFRASVAAKKQKVVPAKTPTQAAAVATAAPSASQMPLTNLGATNTVRPSQRTAVPTSNARVGLFLQTLDTSVSLLLPYLWVQQAMPVKSLASFVMSQLQLDGNVHYVQLECEGSVLQPNVTLQSVSRQWYCTHSASDLVVVKIRIEQRTA